MNEKFCQSCAMPLTPETLGTSADGSKNEDYCCYCMQGGKFTSDCTMEEMADFCASLMVKEGFSTDRQAAKARYLEIFPQLKRWQKA